MSRALWRNDEPTEWGVEVFTEGECWTLAYYLHRLGGWPVVMLGPPGDPTWYNHVVVKIGRGKYLDVQGPQRKSDMLQSWGPGVLELSKIVFYDWVHFQSVVGGDHLYTHPHSRARVMARRLVEKWQLL